MRKPFIPGRINMSATIFVPYDCTNKCGFCTTKHLYADIGDPDETMRLMEANIQRLCLAGVTTFTLTGGEPLADLARCKVILDMIKKHVRHPEELLIFINTSLPKGEGVDAIIDFVNDPDNHIDGISVSRHRNSYEDDLRLLADVFEDDLLARFKTSVRINCLVTRLLDKAAFVERFAAYPQLKINFRANYMRINSDNLHTEEDPTYIWLRDNYRQISHTECNVCNTDSFVVDATGQDVSYHRGIFTTSIEWDDEIEVNDFVIDMFGNLYYDWIFDEDHLATNDVLVDMMTYGLDND